MKHSYFFLRAIMFLLCAGCGANFNTAYREFDVNKGHSVSVDAKQRVILVSNDKGRGGRTIVCAEPSPDALSAVAASLTASGSYSEKVAVQLAAATAESTTNIGLRTQTIQLLRDAMYRLCEGYMGAAVNDLDFARLQRRYQNAMLGLLAIEQLTGAMTPKQVILTSQSGGDVGRKLVKAQKALQKAQEASDVAAKDLEQNNKFLQEEKAKLTSLTEKSDQAKAAAEADPSKQGEADQALAAVTKQKETVDAVQKEVDTKTAVAEAADKQEEGAQEAVEAAKTVSGRAVASGMFDPQGAIATANRDTVAIVSGTVQQIVNDIVTADYTHETCVNSIVSRPPGTVSTDHDAGLRFCTKFLEAATQKQAVKEEEYTKQLEKLKAR